ncbi:alcohol dehydrogenase family protein [Streptomyces sp. NPDC005820]|uniref:alcohol dehydrogenase family protein n=1 Tax=Streptomyces sp. NPDC005820 TaxID=3157069 RepID=UPI0033F3E0B4
MVPEVMRAMVLTGHGGIDKLVYREDYPVPSPASGQVLIRVKASSVNNTDINTRTGWYAPGVTGALTPEIGLLGLQQEDADMTWDRNPLGFPRVQGAAIAGEIVAVGEGVPADRTGERVIVDPVIRDARLPRWARGVVFVGSECDGGYAEYAAVAAENAFPVRTELSDAELACFPCAYSTAEEMLQRTQVSEGETVLVTGASGGVGSANVQLARLRGARVVAVAGASKEAAVRELGADFFIPREEGDLAGAVHRLVGERSVDVVADVTGGPALTDMLRVLRRGGRYVTGGAIAGPVPPIDLRDLIYKDLTMIGVANPERDSFVELVRHIESGELRPVVDKVFPLRELPRAHEYFVRKAHVGKVVIAVSE